MGDRLQVGYRLGKLLRPTQPLGQLSFLPTAGLEMSTSQGSVSVLCGWEGNVTPATRQVAIYHVTAVDSCSTSSVLDFETVPRARTSSIAVDGRRRRVTAVDGRSTPSVVDFETVPRVRTSSIAVDGVLWPSTAVTAVDGRSENATSQTVVYPYGLSGLRKGDAPLPVGPNF